MNTRTREGEISRDGDSIQIQQIVETEFHYICPNCPGSPGMVAINGIKAEALQALWFASKAQGFGFIHAMGKTHITLRECKDLLEQQTYFDYLHGRVMKVDLSGSEFDPRLYDRDNGVGAAADAVGQLRLHPVDHRNRDYNFSVWAVEKPAEMGCPRCETC